MKTPVEEVAVYGIDIGKNNFHVVGLATAGQPLMRTKFRRDRLLRHFANTSDAIHSLRLACQPL